MPKKIKNNPDKLNRNNLDVSIKCGPVPRPEDEKHRGSAKPDGKLALITGGDSGIGRAVAIAFAKVGAIDLNRPWTVR